jgi:hypothetical protein
MPILALLPLAGLAEICLERGDPAQALGHANAMLNSVPSIESLVYLWEPFPVYLTLYRVLEANRDRRAAQALEIAHSQLLAHAARIDNEDLRRAYLENVPARREILALWKSRARF